MEFKFKFKLRGDDDKVMISAVKTNVELGYVDRQSVFDCVTSNKIQLFRVQLDMKRYIPVSIMLSRIEKYE